MLTCRPSRYFSGEHFSHRPSNWKRLLIKQKSIALLSILFLVGANDLPAHPGSGIVADHQGNVYFVDTGSGVWKIDRDGKLTLLSGPAYHWMAIDLDGQLKDAKLPSTGDGTITRIGINPTLLLSSDFPISVGPNGSLYYPWLPAGEQLQVFCLAPSGNTNSVKALPADAENGPLRWLNGLATGPDGSVYYTDNSTVRKITPQGKIATVADNVGLSGCDSIPGMEAHLGPYFRGLDVDSQGTVYVAASGCGAVIKITADKIVTTVLRTSSPWSPTGVALSGSDLYVLEYFHTVGDDRREWIPRVRKVASDGRVTTVATINR